jgi:hypothetical protein
MVNKLLSEDVTCRFLALSDIFLDTLINVYSRTLKTMKVCPVPAD